MRTSTTNRAHETDMEDGAARSRAASAVLSIIISVVLFYGLYRNLDVQAVIRALGAANTGALALAITMTVPITALMALRLFWVAPDGSIPSLGEATRLTLVAAAANVFMPAKSGDLIKSYFIAARGRVPIGVAVSVVAYDRLADIFGLVGWCLVGWMASAGRPSVLPAGLWLVLAMLWFAALALTSSQTIGSLLARGLARSVPLGRTKVSQVINGWSDLIQSLNPRRRTSLLCLSLLIWLLHLLQVMALGSALHLGLPWATALSLIPLAILAGQVPLTFAGIGTRDVAMVLLLSPYVPAEAAAALGILVSVRGLLPALVSAPFLREYASAAVADAARRFKTA
jgi:uncharacterized protein (TIRG00374 family)